MKSFIRTTRIDDISSNEAFSWHIREGAFERINPPWQQFKVIERKGSIQSNGTVKIKMNIGGPFHTTWLVKHSDYIEGEQLEILRLLDFFHHGHILICLSRFSKSPIYMKIIHGPFSLPGGAIGRMITSRIINKKLNQIFDYRHRLTREDLRIHAAVNRVRGDDKPMTIAITGSSRFIGSSLIPFLTTGGHRVVRLMRSPTSPDNDRSLKNVKSIQWNPLSTHAHTSSLNDNDNIDAVVNLAGENIFGRWTKEKKKRIFDSRVNTTKSLCKLLSSVDKPPKVLVSASATGYYGDKR